MSSTMSLVNPLKQVARPLVRPMQPKTVVVSTFQQTKLLQQSTAASTRLFRGRPLSSRCLQFRSFSSSNSRFSIEQREKSRASTGVRMAVRGACDPILTCTIAILISISCSLRCDRSCHGILFSIREETIGEEKDRGNEQRVRKAEGGRALQAARFEWKRVHRERFAGEVHSGKAHMTACAAHG